MRKALGWLIVLSLLAATGWWFVIRPQQQAGEQRQPVITTSPLAPTGVERFEKALGSDDKSVQAKVMSPELAQAYLASGQNFLPDGATIRLKPEAFAMTGDAAKVEAEVKPKIGNTTSFQLVLVRNSEDNWELLNTEGK